MTYTELKDALALYVEDFEVGFLGSLDTFIRAAEQRIYNTAQLPPSEMYAPLTVATNTITVPAGYLSTNYLVVNDVTLEQKDISFLREAYGPAETGAPRYYAQKNESTLVVVPVPDVSYDGELAYFAYPESIVTAGNTWLGDNYDQALLYGALVEASIFLKSEPDTMASYKEQFNGYMTLLKQQVDAKVKSDEFRDGKTRVTVI